MDLHTGAVWTDPLGVNADRGGVWWFGRRDDGYVGLFSAKDDCVLLRGGRWADREILCEDRVNVFICQVGHQGEVRHLSPVHHGLRRGPDSRRERASISLLIPSSTSSAATTCPANDACRSTSRTAIRAGTAPHSQTSVSRAGRLRGAACCGATATTRSGRKTSPGPRSPSRMTASTGSGPATVSDEPLDPRSALSAEQQQLSFCAGAHPIVTCLDARIITFCHRLR